VIYFDPTKPSSRSNDITKNVVSLGKIMADALNGKGISTLHCEIAFDEQDYDNSYTRAAQKIQEYLEEYPSIKYVIDIHRDSIDTSDGSGNRIKPVIGVGDTTAAQVMFVVAAGSESDHPNWKANLALAQRLREEMHGTAPGICRPTMLKDKADYYNQQYSAFSILLEIGTDCNTLAEATLSAELAAEAIAKTIIE
jgi:stage II sporulation protein P